MRRSSGDRLAPVPKRVDDVRSIQARETDAKAALAERTAALGVNLGVVDEVDAVAGQAPGAP